jgi:membrane protein DedA with SNARE-associated domain
MNAIVQFLLEHGYSVLFAASFAHQIGFPLPGPLFLLAAGALAAKGALDPGVALGVAVLACVLADWVWYEAGRRMGDRVLRFIHRLAPDPALAEQRAKERFAKHGPPTLLFCKFVPGLDAVVPPMTGASGTSRIRFLLFETAGAALYSWAYGSLGFAFSHDLDRAATYIARAGRLLAVLMVATLSIYAARKFVHWYRFIRNSRTAPITAPDHMNGDAPLPVNAGD